MFWEKFNTLCKTSDKSEAFVAKEIGASNSLTSKWKNGTLPSFKMLINIADYFDCSVDYLLGRETDDFASSGVISEQEKTLLNSFRQLNEQGREKCIDYLDDLIDTEKYKKHSKSKLVEKQA